jgi:tetratricopeptide (TPR) repeat protein
MDEREIPPSLATPSLREAIAAHPGAQRLLSAVQLADSFELEIVACPTLLHAKARIAWLSERLPDPQPVCHLAARRSDVTNRVGMEEIARDILGPLSSATDHRPVYLDASAAHIDEHAAWRWMFHRLNERRNELATTLSSPLIMLLPRWLEPVLPAEAPDLWSIRSVTIELPGNEPVRREQDRVEQHSSFWIEDLEDLRRQVEVRRDRANSGSMADRTAYAAALRRYVNAALGRVKFEELRRRVDEELIPLTATLDDAIERARALRTQAAVRLRQGDTNAALEILQALVLPIVEQDDAEHAAALGEIADVLETRGDLDEALRIRREDQLPIFERIGDVRSIAVTTTRIADILRERGEFDEALRILRKETLPVFERLGDLHSKAATMGNIAEILYARGEFDEALRILREEALPVFERLGDVRWKAMMMEQIADILQERGDLDEALPIRHE